MVPDYVDVTTCSLTITTTACVVDSCLAGYNSNGRSGTIVCDITGGEDNALSYGGDGLFCAPALCTAGSDGATGTIDCDEVGGTVGGKTGSCTCDCNAGYTGNDCAADINECADISVEYPAILYGSDDDGMMGSYGSYGSYSSASSSSSLVYTTTEEATTAMPTTTHEAACGAGGTCTQTNDGSSQTVNTYYCSCAAGYEAGGEQAPCTGTGPKGSVEGTLRLGGIAQDFFEENTDELTAAFTSTLATTADVDRSWVTISSVEYVEFVLPETLQRRLGAEDASAGSVLASYSIIVTSKDQATNVESAILATASGKGATEFASLFVDAVQLSTGTVLNITVEEVGTESSYDDDGSDDDGSDDEGILLIVVGCVVAGVVILLIIAVAGYFATHSGRDEVLWHNGDKKKGKTRRNTFSSSHTSATSASYTTVHGL